MVEARQAIEFVFCCFLDALASLEFKLSVSQGCFSASASSGLLELFSKFHSRKTRESRHFWKQMRMEDVLPILNCSFLESLSGSWDFFKNNFPILNKLSVFCAVFKKLHVRQW